jgi:IS5 family transposase
VPFKHHAEHRHHIPKPRYRVTNWPEYDEALRRRGSLTVWFTDEAIVAWRAEPRTTPGGQPFYSALAIATALTIRAVFSLALRQTEGLIGSIIALLGLTLTVPDHSTMCRRGRTLVLPPLRRSGTGPLDLLVDSTGLKLGGAGEWLIEKHGTSRRRSWRKLHIGIDAGSGEIVAIELTEKDVDDAARTRALLDQITDPVASFTADGAYDQDRVYDAVAECHANAAVQAREPARWPLWSVRRLGKPPPADAPRSSLRHAPAGRWDDGAQRGAMLVLIAADIARQFEFVQKVWMGDGDFAGLGSEKDPLLGQNDGTGGFTVPRRAAPRLRLTGLPAFVSTRGGEYFFLPGLQALAELARRRG